MVRRVRMKVAAQIRQIATTPIKMAGSPDQTISQTMLALIIVTARIFALKGMALWVRQSFM